MPLPNPNSNEDHDDFISRCMSDPLMRDEYPQQDQRAAVCQSQWDKDKQESKMSAPRWMSSMCLRQAPKGEINDEKGIIEGVSIVSVGAAEGHGVNLDREFIQTVARMAGDKKQGLKARFGHPNICSTALGTFIGRFKNFREGRTEREGKEVEAVIGDLYLSNSAKETPHGDLYNYIVKMAQDEPDMFGTSIVFTPGKTYRRDIETNEKVYVMEYDAADDRKLTEEIFVECEALHACDAVDEPAANDGLFSKFSGETMAGQVTEFLDLHPQVWHAISGAPEVLEALSRYGDKVDEFINRYAAYRKSLAGQYQCECIECGHTQSSDEHCKDIPCPECGGTMRRSDRPGPGEPVSQERKGKMTKEKPNSEQMGDQVEEAAEEKVVDEESSEEQSNEAKSETAEEAAQPEGDEEEKSADNEAKVDADGEDDDAEKADESDDDGESGELSRDEFIEIAEQFGDEIAVKVLKDGGDFDDAMLAYCDMLKTENKELKEKMSELGISESGGQAHKVVAEKGSARLFNTGK